MDSRIAAPAGQRVTFVELFFDLVFVFSVTKVVGLIHGHVSWTAVGQAVLVFWLVWWAWTQFTWALNAANTTHPAVQLGTLAATAVAFLMVVAVPHVFQGRALSFAISYVLVRLLGLGLYAWVASGNPAQRTAVMIFGGVALTGLTAVLVGAALGGNALIWWWFFAIGLDVVSALVGGRQRGWGLHFEHFCERNALFVIIALGESLIVAASSASESDWSRSLFAVALLSVATACALWWNYFGKAREWLEHALAACTGVTQSRMARDVFSLFHFPMLLGVVAYAVAIEEILAQPGDPLHLEVRVLLAVGVALFSGFIALEVWRATGVALWPRVLLTLATAAGIMVTGNAPPVVPLLVMLAGLAIIAVVEQRLGHLDQEGAPGRVHRVPGDVAGQGSG